MNRDEKELKRELLEELESRELKDAALKDILSEENKVYLGEDFTKQVMEKIRPLKKPSPITRITRIALPITACAAAVVICFTLGISEFSKNGGIHTVQTDAAYKYFDQEATEDGFIIGEGTLYDGGAERVEMPAQEPGSQAPDTDGFLYGDGLPLDELEPEVTEEAEEAVDIQNTVTNSALEDKEKPSDPSTPKEDTEKAHAPEAPATAAGSIDLYASNLAVATENVETFKAYSDANAEESAGEIVLHLSQNYAEYTLFGNERYDENSDTEYEMIVTLTALEKEELISDMEEFINAFSTAMNKAYGKEEWNITLGSFTLPDAITPNTVIKIIKEQDKE